MAEKKKPEAEMSPEEQLAAQAKANMSGDPSGAVEVSEEPTDPKQAVQPQAGRVEEVVSADTEARQALELERERQRETEIQAAQHRARQMGAEAQRPIMVTDAVVRASLAAQAEFEASQLKLDIAPPLGAVYVVNGVEVNADGIPVRRK